MGNRSRVAAHRAPASAPGAARLAHAALPGCLLLGLLFVLPGAARAEELRGARILPPDRVELRLSEPLPAAALQPGNFRVSDATAPDIPLTIRSVAQPAPDRVLLTVEGKVSAKATYRLEILEPRASRTAKPSPWGLLLTVVVSAALINNFVFTRYLGLCIFFGVSKKRDAALGMGLTFTFVMLTTGMLSWAIYMFVMKPLQLRFLQVLVFIGVVACLVQFLDTFLKKTQRELHKKFGIYLVLITTNCIILAVPLLNAASDASPLEAFGLAMGSGLGFALALFLMSCARERVELARVPESFQGLPIAFALAGLFALAFMGFSGLSFTR